MRLGPTELIICFITIALFLLIGLAIRATSSAATRALQNQGKMKCPYCGETIKKGAIYCRFCHRDLVKEV